MIRRLLALTAVAVALVAAPAAPASGARCGGRPCVCWDCLDGPFVGCYDIDPVVNDLCV